VTSPAHCVDKVVTIWLVLVTLRPITLLPLMLGLLNEGISTVEVT
jgi:hypothetical protein